MAEPVTVMQACVISGAANGIGRATLQLFAANGYRCIGIDNNEQAISDMRGELGADTSSRVRFLCADLLSTELRADDLLGLGLLDGDAPVALTLVNNLGGSTGSPLIDAGSWDDFAEALTFNLKPLFTLTRACLPIMKGHANGRIVNVASVVARTVLPTVGPAYAAAKAAVVGVSRHLASELCGYGILVNTVCPGIIATERIKNRWAHHSDEVKQSLLNQIPAGRLGDPTEIAEAIYFLGSTANYTNGAILDVNGGRYMP